MAMKTFETKDLSPVGEDELIIGIGKFFDDGFFSITITLLDEVNEELRHYGLHASRAVDE